MKVVLLWLFIILASVGTYFLSNKIENGVNMAAVFLAQGKKHEILIYSEKAEPNFTIAHPGEEVIFIVKDDSKHNISEERSSRRYARLESGEIGKNESYSLLFQNPGVYSFYDRQNQDIRVTITVK